VQLVHKLGQPLKVRGVDGEVQGPAGETFFCFTFYQQQGKQLNVLTFVVIVIVRHFGAIMEKLFQKPRKSVIGKSPEA
jgi:hypothetical protein